MIDLVLIKFLRDYTPYKAGATAAFAPAVAQKFQDQRVAEIVGPLKEEIKPEEIPSKGHRKSLEVK